MEQGARKAPTSVGTRAAPHVRLVRAATRAGKLSVAHPDTRVQVAGDGVQQGGDYSGLAAIQGFQAVQAHVGDALKSAFSTRSLTPWRDSMTWLNSRW